MVKNATVVSVKNGMATVEAMRTSACDECKMPCPASKQKGKVIRIDVPAIEGLMPGDEVELETSSKNMLGMAFMVYIFPLIAAVIVYVVLGFTGLEDQWRALGALGGLVLAFVPALLINGRLRRRQGGIYTVKRRTGQG